MTLHVVPINVVDGSVNANIEVTGTGSPSDPAFTFFSGADGTAKWDAGLTPAQQMLQDLEALGNVVQVYWATPWLQGTSGPKALGARPKAAIDWVQANVAAEVRATGNSGGATQLAYALSFHAADVERAVFTGGPTHTLLTLACMGPGAFEDSERQNVDASYGNTHCFDQDLAGKTDWDEDSLDTNDGEFLLPPTTFIMGCQDESQAPDHARAYVARLRDAGTQLQYKRVVTMTHIIQSNQRGCDLLKQVLTG